MADVVLNLIEPLEQRFRWGDKSDEQIALQKRDMVDAFKGHDIEVLKAAMLRIVMHRKFSTMPTVGDVNEVVARVIAERKEAESKPSARRGVPPPRDVFLEGLKHEQEDAKAWAREWLQKTPLGQESLRDGWCRDLHNLIWQIRRNRMRANKPCEFDDIKLDDIATQSMHGFELIERLRANRAPNVELERKLVLNVGFA